MKAVYVVYKASPGIWQARNSETGEVLVNGMFQPISNSLADCLIDYLNYLGISWKME